MIIASVIIIFVYALLILRYTFALTKEELLKNNNIVKSVGIIVPFRNEENNLPTLVEAFEKQKTDYQFEVVFVNDHSSDSSIEKIKQKASSINYRIMELDDTKTGKKEALKLGVSSLDSEILVFIDADCIPSALWLDNLLRGYSKETKMVCGPVLPTKGNFFQSYFFAPDFLALMLAGAGGININRGVMCNGANMSVSRSAFDNDYLNINHQSGDDVFLLHAIKKKYGGKSIKFVNSSAAAVKTDMPKTYSEYLSQRLRWSSKARLYSDIDSIFLSVLILFANISFILLLIMSFQNRNSLIIYTLLIKSLVDFFFLFKGLKQYRILKHLLFFPFSLIFTSFNIVFTGILSRFFIGTWKQRKINF